jgi:hypothetical protein
MPLIYTKAQAIAQLSIAELQERMQAVTGE